jgi:Xaa-Pro aminopeptidase
VTLATFERSYDEALVEILRKEGRVRIGIEAAYLPVGRFNVISAGLAARASLPIQSDDAAPVLVPTERLVERSRIIKDSVEVATLREAGRRLGSIARRVHTFVAEGRTELSIAAQIDSALREAGFSRPAFETIVAAGPNSAIPHHRPTSAVLATGDFVKLDFGARVDGYHSDMTRTLVLGEPADWQREIYDLVHDAQLAGRFACTIGATGDAIDAASRTVIAEAGYGPQFAHGLGHGVGLQIHEAPSLARQSPSIMVPDMCVTVEPGVYLPGRGGVRIEDSGVIRVDGYHVLTQTSKELVVLA